MTATKSLNRAEMGDLLQVTQYPKKFEVIIERSVNDHGSNEDHVQWFQNFKVHPQDIRDNDLIVGSAYRFTATKLGENKKKPIG